MPAVVLAAATTALLARMTRATMLEVVRQDYVRTAKAKGLSQRVVIFKHALKNAMIPIITVIGLQFGGLLGGALLTETVFTWPGLGTLTISAVEAQDLPLVQGVVILVAIRIGGK
jgi:peptide/nickel transport system permease protein